MPSLGADMEEGVLVEWRVKPGDPVKRGDIIAVVHTEKADIEVEVFETGVVEKLLVQAGAKVPVGTVLANIRGDRDAAKPGSVAAVKSAVPVPSAPLAVRAFEKPAAADRRVSPLARKLAKELGVDLNLLPGTGPHGAIEKADVERAAKAQAASGIGSAAARPPEGAYVGMRKAIAAAMARSNREIPHYYLETQMDMSSAMRWLDTANRARPIQQRLLPVALLLKAVACALREVPELNGYWKEDRHEQKSEIHLGFAISLRQGGLIVPAILNADQKSLDEMMAAMSDLIQRTRMGRLRSSEITDGTVTVTNLGDRGVETVFGVIYPPQVALIGFGRITDRPWVESGMIAVRPVLTATLAGDHRATDGRRGAQFLEALRRWLQQPEKL